MPCADTQESHIDPWPRYFWKVSRYTSHFYRDTFAKVCPQFVSRYASHLYRDAFFRSIRIRGRWNTPKTPLTPARSPPFPLDDIHNDRKTPNMGGVWRGIWGFAERKRKGFWMNQCAWQTHGLCDMHLAEACLPKLWITEKYGVAPKLAIWIWHDQRQRLLLPWEWSILFASLRRGGIAKERFGKSFCYRAFVSRICLSWVSSLLLMWIFPLFTANLWPAQPTHQNICHLGNSPKNM